MFLAACGAGEPVSTGATVRDSAGVTIVENVTPAWRAAEAWTVAGEPDLEIGVLEGDEPYQLHDVRDAARLSDGRVVVLNAGTRELRYYDAHGRHLRSAGGSGGGPGEFRAPTGFLRLAGDSVLVVDWRNQRLSTYDGEGNLVGSFRSPPVQGRLADGTLLRRIPVRRGDAPAPEGYARDSVALVRVSAVADQDGPRVEAARGAVEGDTVVWAPGDEVFRVIERDGPFMSVTVLPAPFAKSHQLAVAGDRIYSGASDDYEIAVHRADGSLERVIRRQVRGRAVSGAWVRRYRDQELARVGDNASRRASRERLLAEMPFPEAMPVYQGFRVDATGHLWVERYRAPGESVPAWDVFTPEGRWLGTVETPEGLRVVEIGEDDLLGVWRDEFDVERVRLHRLERP